MFATENMEPKEFNSFVSPVTQFIELLKHPEVQAVFQSMVETAIAVSETKILKRLKAVEVALDLNEWEKDEDQVSIPERIEVLEEKIHNTDFRPPEKSPIKITDDSKTYKRALHLINELRASGKTHLTHKQIKACLTGSDIDDDYRVDPISSNPRKTIIDTLKKAVNICSDVVINRKENGHKEYRLVLKS